MVVGKTTIRFYRAAYGNNTIAASSTNFADGKGFSCDIDLSTPIERTDLEAMEQVLDLDGQIVTADQVSLGS